jgi:hypothetical protein
MEQALTTTNTNLPANVNEPFDSGLEALDRGDVIIPRLTITQPSTPDIDAVNVGKFSVNITGDFYDNMRLVCIKLTKGRILWPEKYSKDNEPLCRSHNFQTPADDIEGAEPMCHTCAVTPGTKDEHECDYANWSADKKGKPIAPRCQEVWNLLVLDLETYMPMYLSLKSTSIKPAKKLFSAINILSGAKRVPLWGWAFGVTLKMESNDSGKFYVPIFTSPTAVSPEELEAMSGIRAQLANVEMRSEDKPDAPPVSTQPAEAEQF